MSLDYQALAKAMDEMRFAIKAMVTGLIDDGFTEEQARAMVAGIVSRQDGEEEKS